MLKTLWLPSWYPNESSSQNGDFIQRHAQAVSMFAKVYVIYISSAKTKKYSLYKKDCLTEEVFLYQRKRDSILNKIISLCKYFFFYRKYIKQYISKYGRPDIVHVHVAVRAGIFALWLKKKYKIPYVVTEHFTIYNLNRKDNYTTKSTLFKLITKKIFENADAFLPVSNDLGEGVNKFVLNIPYSKVANVVNTNIFFPINNESGNFTFIHVSTLVKNKNPVGIINAFAQLLKENEQVCLKIIGCKDDNLINLSKKLKISENKIAFISQISNEEVAQEMKRADCFILFSYYENLPCVIAESLCCGIPVIATDVGGVKEMINEDNGVLIKAGNEQMLLDAMKKIINEYNKFDKYKISEEAQKLYNYETIGQQIVDEYKKVLAKKAAK